MPLIFEAGDAPSNSTTTQSLGIGDIIQGQQNASSDTSDFYRVTLQAGTTYEFAMVGTGADRLLDPVLRLIGPDGTTVVVENDDGFSGRNARISFTADTSGTYFLDASQFLSGGTGFGGSTYRLSASIAQNGKALVDNEMIVGAIDSGDNWLSTNVTYGFRINPATYTLDDGDPATHDSDISTFTALTAEERTAVQACLQNISEVCGLTFTETANDQGTLLFGNYMDPLDGAGAFAYFPGDTAPTSAAGDVWLNTDSVSTTDLPLGSYSYVAILHEIGHAMGLSHPGAYNAAPGQAITYANDARFAQDSSQYSVMSYFDEADTNASFGAQPFSLMLYDIAALQLAYGSNATTRSGATVYGYGSTAGAAYDLSANANAAFCIWDGGGDDTLSAAGFAGAQILNLAAGAFSNIGGFINNVSIAFGTIIENAIGGSGIDTITGNSEANALTGGLGSDTLNGGGGNDTASYAGSAAGVSVDLKLLTAQVSAGDASGDVLISIENLTGSSFNDSLFGDGGVNRLEGGDGADFLNGGYGGDALFGGNGTDTISFIQSRSGVTVNLATGVGTTGEAAGDTYNSIELVRGSLFWDNLTAASAGSTLYGFDGGDILAGGNGNDVLDGGEGGDVLLGGAGTDIAYYSSGSGAISINMVSNVNTGGEAQGDLFSGVEQISGTASGDTILGNSLANLFYGNGGNDRLGGGTGADTLLGGLGSDTFVFAIGDTGQTAATLDQVFDYAKGAVGVGDKIDFASALTVGGVATAATATQASINAATGVASFAAGSGTTMADALADIATSMTTGVNAVGEFALFRINNAGTFYQFISDGVAGVGVNDVLVQLSGVTTVATIDLAGGDLTILT
jgi:serralysin